MNIWTYLIDVKQQCRQNPSDGRMHHRGKDVGPFPTLTGILTGTIRNPIPVGESVEDHEEEDAEGDVGEVRVEEVRVGGRGRPRPRGYGRGKLGGVVI